MHEAQQVTLPTTVPGQSLQGYAVSGTALWYPGQQGERMARDEAARMNRKEHDEQPNERSGAGVDHGGDGSDDGAPNAAPAVDPREGRRTTPAVAEEPAAEVQAEPQAKEVAPEPSQAELAVLYRDRIKFHKNAGKDSTRRIAAAAKDVPGYVVPAAKKRRKVI